MLLIRALLILTFLFGCRLHRFCSRHVSDGRRVSQSHTQRRERLSVDAKGDLNGDGAEDWVGVIHGQPADEAPTYQLFVLVRDAAGGYRIAEKTQKAEIPGMGCCWLEDLTIRRGSIFIQNNAKTASTMEAATHQFKLQEVTGDWSACESISLTTRPRRRRQMTVT